MRLLVMELSITSVILCKKTLSSPLVEEICRDGYGTVYRSLLQKKHRPAGYLSQRVPLNIVPCHGVLGIKHFTPGKCRIRTILRVVRTKIESLSP